MRNPFIKHPSEVDETYLEHLWLALRYALTFLLLFFVALIYAVFPFWFRKTASCAVQDMAKTLEEREGKG